MGSGVIYTVLRWMASTGLEFDLLGSFRMTWDMTSSGNKALVRFTESYLGSTKPGAIYTCFSTHSGHILHVAAAEKFLPSDFESTTEQALPATHAADTGYHSGFCQIKNDSPRRDLVCVR
jgi:hypothetical protein